MFNALKAQAKSHLSKVDEHVAAASKAMRDQEQAQLQAAWHILQAEKHNEEARKTQAHAFLVRDLQG